MDIIEKDKNKDEFNVDKFANNLINIYIQLYISGCDFTQIIDESNFNIDSYESLKEYNNEFTLIYDKIKELITNQHNNSDENIPEELLDPLTFQLIDDPCLLPGMVGFSDEEIFFDKSTIMKQLLIKEENPYTRATLTIEEFETFNQKLEIVDKNNTFKDKILVWKKSKL